jgi:hypothetical protein
VLEINQTADGVEATDMENFATPWAHINANSDDSQSLPLQTSSIRCQHPPITFTEGGLNQVK